MGDDDQRATSSLMNMINGRSHQELAPTISSPHFPAAPSTAEADDIRRRNLMLSTATGAQQNGTTPGGGKKRVLAPESSSPQTQQQPGGFLAPGEAFNPALLQFRNPPTTLARGDSDEDILGTQSLHRGGSFNGTSLQAAAATRGNEPPPRKKLMRAGDYEQRNSRDTSAEVEEVGPSITSPVASASGSPVTSPAHLPGTNTPLTAMRQNLSHVHLQRTASNTSSTASLHGRSGLSRNDDESLPSVLDAVPVSASAEDGAMPEDESSPAVGRRRRTAAKKRIVETDDEDADGDFDIEMGGGDDDGGSDGEYLDEEQAERKAPAPVPQAHRTAPQTQPPQYQQYQHPQQQLRAPVPIQPRHATIPDQQQAYRQQHSMSPHLMSPHHGVSPHAISPMPYSQPSPSMAFAQLAPTRSPSTMSQPLPPAQASGNFTQDAVATAQEAFVRFRSGCFPMMPFNEVRQAWIESGGRPDLATTILINKSANVDRRTPAQWSEPPAATRSPVMAPAPAPSSGRPLIPVPHPSSFAPQQQFAPQQPQSPYGAQAGQPSPYNLPSYPQTSAYSTAPSYIPQPQPPMIQIQSQMTRVAQSPSGPPLSAGYRGPPTGSSGGSVYSPHGAYGQSSGYPRPMQGHPLPYAQPPQPGRANIQQYAPPQNQYGVQPQQYRPAQYAPQPQQQQRQPYQQPITQVPQPQQQVLLKKKRRADSEDSDGGYSDNDTGDRYNERDRAEKESQALRFFNVCKVEDLQDLTTCTNAQAKLIGELRPFDSVDDVRQKLRKTKGVSGNLFDNYVDVIQAYSAVDKVFDECKRVGDELSRIMRIWKAAAQAAKPATSTGTPTNEEQEKETGVNFTELNDKLVQESLAKTNVSPHLKEAFEGYLHVPPKGVPDTITLKGYQMLGINWLYLLYRKKHSCILADEMGLGKTCQVIAFLSHIKSIGEQGPHLIIVPSSTLENWLREFATFAPDLAVESYYGSQKEREELRYDLKENLEKIDVIVTTYNIAAGGNDDRKFMRKCRFKTCTYDEGHQLKNSESKKHKDLMALDVPWRLLLTGTPLQNNLTELISLLSFILPDIIGRASEELRAIFKVPVGAKANMLSKRRIEAAKNVMTPFVMRRKKLQVLQELPSKSERIEYCELTPMQREVYREAVNRSKKALIEATESDEVLAEAMVDGDMAVEDKPKAATKRGFTKKGTIRVQQHSASNVLMDLRKASNHPMLFRRLYPESKLRVMAKDCLKEPELSDRDPDLIFEDMEIMTDYELHRFVQSYPKLKAKYELKDEEWMQAGKVQALRRLLPEHLEKGDRVLLFSQFTQVLEILETVLDTMGIRWLKLTGQTNVTDRQSLVDEFYADEGIGVFLLSTRAGGLGINLAAANIVIMHDQDFNPHNDRQAEDRAWRIGQTRDVKVIRLITRGTIEEDIYALAQTKLALDKEVTMHVASADMIGDAPAEPTNVTEEKMDVKPAKARSGRKKAPGEAPAKPEGVAEGDEAASAKLMSRSLLSRLRDRFAEDDKTATQGEATSSAPPTSDAALDTAATSLDAVKEEVKEGDKPDVDMADGDGEAAPV